MSESYHHGNLRQALLEATLDEIEDTGVDGLSLRKLAGRVGVSRAAPYHHFQNKEALLAAAIEEGFRQMHARTQAVLAEIDDPWDCLKATGRVYVAFAVDRPALYRLMFGSSVTDKSQYPEVKACAGAYYDDLRRMIRDCVSTGETRHEDVELAAFTTWCSVHGFASLLLDGALERAPAELGDAPDAALVDAVLDGITYGLRVPPREAP